MAPPRSLALVLVVAAFVLLVASASAASDAPFLVAHKKVALTRPKPGLERLAVSLDLYNQGSALFLVTLMCPVTSWFYKFSWLDL